MPQEGRIERALAAWGRDARLGAAIGSGNRNDVRLITIAGKSFVGRLSIRPAPALFWELDLLEWLHAAGLRVPRSVAAKDGRRCVDGLVVFSWLDGDLPASAHDWQAVAAELKRLHALTRDWNQRPGFRATRDLLDHDLGGDVRLDLMPPEAVARCRAAWRSIVDEPVSVVHGDPGRTNIRISCEGVGFIDWDESRVDASVLDLADLPTDASALGDARHLNAARDAANAWEAANGWIREPKYARWRLDRLPAHATSPAP